MLDYYVFSSPDCAARRCPGNYLGIGDLHFMQFALNILLDIANAPHFQRIAFDPARQDTIFKMPGFKKSHTISGAASIATESSKTGIFYFLI
jgi:hypothetical protein